MITHEQLATDLLEPLWRGIPAGYKSRYARSIWQQFEDNIRSAAYTARLAAFVDGMVRKLGIELRADDMVRVQSILQANADRAALKLLREETTYLVLLVRVANDARKAARAAEEIAGQQEELF